MSLAADTREAVRNRPVLYDALCAGIVNYTAAAESLDVDGDTDAIATALRRFGQSLAAEDDESSTGAAANELADGTVTVRMRSGLDRVAAESLVVAVDGRGLSPTQSTHGEKTQPDQPAETELTGDSGTGRLTAIEARGSLSPTALAPVIRRLRIADVSVLAAAADADALVVVVPQRAGVRALRTAERALSPTAARRDR